VKPLKGLTGLLSLTLQDGSRGVEPLKGLTALQSARPPSAHDVMDLRTLEGLNPRCNPFTLFDTPGADLEPDSKLDRAPGA